MELAPKMIFYLRDKLRYKCKLSCLWP